VRQELQAALDLAGSVPAAELPRLLGDLREVEAVALARLASPPIETKDELLDVPTAAARLSVSPDYLYRNHRRFPFVRRMGKRLLFSSAGLDAYLKRSR
jgi:hypothetical protein